MLFNNAYFVLYCADADRNKAVIKHPGPGVVLSSILYWGRSKIIYNYRVIHELKLSSIIYWGWRKGPVYGPGNNTWMIKYMTVKHYMLRTGDSQLLNLCKAHQ